MNTLVNGNVLRRSWRICAMGGLAVLMATGAFAQGMQTGELTGTIKDSGGLD
ncbi:MAG: hypothetical protein M3451_10860 [Chloroflexota bacterium]|nr:hypothetical protein [Acidobacteriota bacterium]MDQ3421623.1 hypothetical protein [Acidobacteriota bacterium]MDQ3525535.1 hypothetical protein [Chloroflexota bacterium]